MDSKSMPTEPPSGGTSDEEYEDAMMVKVLSEVAAIEAEMKAAAADGSVDLDVDKMVYNRLVTATDSNASAEKGSRSDMISITDPLVIPPHPVYGIEQEDDPQALAPQEQAPEITSTQATAIPTVHTNHANSSADPFDQWVVGALRFPNDATEIAAVAMRHQNHHHHHVVHASGLPLSVLPAVGACVLFFVLASWSQLRRSRRRVLEQRDDLMREMDLMESAYRDHSGPAGYLL